MICKDEVVLSKSKLKIMKNEWSFNGRPPLERSFLAVTIVCKGIHREMTVFEDKISTTCGRRLTS